MWNVQNRVSCLWSYGSCINMYKCNQYRSLPNSCNRFWSVVNEIPRYIITFIINLSSYPKTAAIWTNLSRRPCVLSSFTTYHQVFNYINTTGATSGALTAYPFEFTPVFSGVRVTRSLVLYVCFVDRCLSFCTFSFGHFVVCSSSIYGFWFPLWHLQTLLSN